MNKKATVDFIKKMAQDLDFFPGTAPPKVAPSGHVAPTTPPEITNKPAPPHVSSGVPQIKNMQQSLINLAHSVTSQINVQDLAGGHQQQNEAESRNSFNNFVTKHFMRGSDVPGVEFDPNPNKTQMNEKSPSQATRMTSVMDTMSRIGNPKTGEMSVDGKWGPRTNAALHNAYAFAFSMLKLASSFQVQVTSYNQEDLTKLKELIPPDSEVAPTIQLTADNIQRAIDIGRHLQSIQKMYGEIKDSVLEKPEYQTYIEGDTPFATYKQSGPVLTAPEKQMFDQLLSGNQQYNKTFQILVPANATKTAQQTTSQGVPYQHDASQDGAKVAISISDLVSSEAFNKWYNSPAANAIRGVNLTTLFNAIRQALQGGA